MYVSGQRRLGKMCAHRLGVEVHQEEENRPSLVNSSNCRITICFSDCVQSTSSHKNFGLCVASGGKRAIVDIEDGPWCV